MAHIVMVLIGDLRYDGRVRKEVRTLVRAAHRVEVIVSQFGGHESEAEDLGAHIHYVPMKLHPSPLRNFIEQLSFNRKAAWLIETIRPSHIHCHDLSTLLAGVWARRKVLAKLVFDAHELMPEMMGGIKEHIWNMIERRCIRKCDSIIMPEKNRIEYFGRKYPGAGEIALLQNFPRRNDIPREKSDIFRKMFPIRKDQTIILYSGGIGPGKHIDDLIGSMAISSEKYALVILGGTFKGYDNKVRGQIEKLDLWGRVFLHGAVPHQMILKYMASCDIGTALYQNTDVNNYYCAPNKLYEYIALGKAVVTNDYPGLRKAVERFHQGVCIAEVTPQKLVDAYERATDGAVFPGARKFFWEDEENILIGLYGD